MAAWAFNAIVLSIAVGAVALLAAGALWRLGQWHLGTVEVLNLEEGLPIGSEAPELAVHQGAADRHLFWLGEPAFVVFGLAGCKPCEQLVEAASRHPATSPFRLVYVNNTGELETEAASVRRWEVYRFHDARAARLQWRAPVSPYFHVIDARGHVVAKGVGNHADHLDRLLALSPSVLAGSAAPDAALAAGG
jgi:hypothetical protein